MSINDDPSIIRPFGAAIRPLVARRESEQSSVISYQLSVTGSQHQMQIAERGTRNGSEGAGE